MTSTCILLGTVNKPELLLRFDPQQPHPAAPEKSLLTWVKDYLIVKCKGRGYWDSKAGAWRMTAVGTDPDRKLALAGFTVDFSYAEGPLSATLSLNEVAHPISRLSMDGSRLMVLPRLTGFELTKEMLGAGAMWNREMGRFEAPVADAMKDGMPRPGIQWDPAIIDAAIAARGRVLVSHSIREQVAAAGAAKDPLELDAADLAKLIDLVGDIPDWYGLDLYPFQRIGAIATAAGHFGLFDEPGLGKTRQFIAAASILGSQRTLITSLPVALTGWAREVGEAQLHTLGGQNPDGEIVVIRANKKEPEHFPEHGVVIVSDSLVASRPALAARLAAWQPEVFGYDEAHRGKTFESARAKSMIMLAKATSKAPIAITGTPLFANPAELAPILEFTGHLAPVFGGLDEYLNRYCRQDQWGRWKPRMEHLTELRMKLEQNVWVRRRKRDVLPDLPKSAISAKWVDVPLTIYREAFKDVRDRIKQWVEHVVKETGALPSPEEVEAWARGQLGLISQLRRAGGLTKIDAIVDDIRAHVEATTEIRDGKPFFTRPLLVWTHHREVTDAMVQAVPAAIARTGVIAGGISHQQRDEYVAAFQRNEIAVMVCSLSAAGVAITLTASSDMFFAESDYTPAVIRQALDRAERIGQTADRILATVYLTEGTLDARIQAILKRKSKVLDAIYGDGNDVSAIDDSTEDDSAAEILCALVEDVIDAGKWRVPRIGVS